MKVAAWAAGEIAQRRMRALVVVVGDPGGDLGAGVVDVEERPLVEVFVSHAR